MAGLGNYGLWGTRHSVGMAVLDRLARQLAVAESWRADGRCCADVALAAARGLQLVLLKPRRLMNLNGLSVASAGEQLITPVPPGPVTALLSPAQRGSLQPRSAGSGPGESVSRSFLGLCPCFQS